MSPRLVQWTVHVAMGPVVDAAPEGDALKFGGSSGFDAMLIGIRATGGTFFWQGTDTFFWASNSVLGGRNGVTRRLSSGLGGIDRTGFAKTNGFSVRCLMD